MEFWAPPKVTRATVRLPSTTPEPTGRDGQDGGQLTGAVGEQQPPPGHAGPDGQEGRARQPQSATQLPRLRPVAHAQSVRSG